MLAQVGSPEAGCTVTCSGMLLSWQKPRRHLCLEQLGLQDTEQQPLCCMSLPCSAALKCPHSVSVRSQQRAVIAMLNPLGRSLPPSSILEAGRQCTVQYIAHRWHSVSTSCTAKSCWSPRAPSSGVLHGTMGTVQAQLYPAVSLNGEALLRGKFCF